LGLELFRHLAPATDNVLFSPTALAAALWLAASGSAGKTKQEMQRVLHTETVHDLDASTAALLASMSDRNQGRDVELHAAVRLWLQPQSPVQQDFASRVPPSGVSSLGEADFVRDPASASASMMRWADEETHRQFAYKLRPCASPHCLMVSSAASFKGRWAVPYTVTTSMPFHFPNGRTNVVPTTSTKIDTRYALVDGVQLVLLPCGGGLTMFVALPESGHMLANLERDLVKNSDKWHHRLESGWEVELYLPQWTAAVTYESTNALAQLGARTATSPAADFSGIAPTLAISAVVHSAALEVAPGPPPVARDELLPHYQTPRAVFRADHPFLYFVEDPETGAVLFIGRVSNPLP
jgi:serpin B